MPGRPATDQQVRLYMENRHHHTQRIAAARSGLSERTFDEIVADARAKAEARRRANG